MDNSSDKQKGTAFLILERGQSEETVKVFALSSGNTVIGRSASTSNPDIKINDPNISRTHAEIKFEGGFYYITDPGSTNGSRLNGQTLEKGRSYRLEDNSLIELAIIQGIPRAALRFSSIDTIPQAQKAESVQRPVWLQIDDERKEVRVDDCLITLSRKEYSLLWFLCRRTGTICSRDEIIPEVWPEAQDSGAVSDATIDQLIHRLREKVEPNPSSPSRIISKKSFGYMLV